MKVKTVSREQIDHMLKMERRNRERQRRYNGDRRSRGKGETAEDREVRGGAANTPTSEERMMFALENGAEHLRHVGDALWELAAQVGRMAVTNEEAIRAGKRVLVRLDAMGVK